MIVDEEAASEFPQNRNTAPSKLRRSKKHCPVCVEPLPKNASRTKLMKECKGCGAHMQLSKTCAKCHGGPIWQGRAGAACQACGFHGKAAAVILQECVR